jgi:reelin
VCTSDRILQFGIRIGDKSDPVQCRRPVDRREAVIVDYSTNNGIVWHVLKHLDPFALNDAPQTVIINLPSNAKTNATVFRWWQPINGQGWSNGIFAAVLVSKEIVVY